MASHPTVSMSESANFVQESGSEDWGSNKSKTNHSQLGTSSDPFRDGIDNFLSQLKYKKSFQEDGDEDNEPGEYSSVLSSSEVSKVMYNLFGKDKSELSGETREQIKMLKHFFKEYIKASKGTSGSKVKELEQELMNNPENLVFRQILGNDPGKWCEAALPMMKDRIRKKALCEQLEADIKAIQQKRRELAKDTAIAKKQLEEAKQNRAKIMEKIHPENLRRLRVRLEQAKSTADALEGARTKHGNSFVTNKGISELLTRFDELKSRNIKVMEEFENVSANDSLPPDVDKAIRLLKERTLYLEALVEEISTL